MSSITTHPDQASSRLLISSQRDSLLLLVICRNTGSTYRFAVWISKISRVTPHNEEGEEQMKHTPYGGGLCPWISLSASQWCGSPRTCSHRGKAHPGSPSGSRHHSSPPWAWRHSHLEESEDVISVNLICKHSLFI